MSPWKQCTNRNPKRVLVSTLLSGVAVVFLLAGCRGVATQGERAARQDLKTFGDVYRPQSQRPPLPTLQTNIGLSNFLHYAVLNQPQVEAAYFDWAAAVPRVTVEHSLPDPRLAFSADIADMVMALMSGLMMDFPGPGKLKAAANVATAESEAKYFRFELSVLQTAFALKKAYYEPCLSGCLPNLGTPSIARLGRKPFSRRAMLGAT